MKKHPWITNTKNQVFTQPFFDLVDLGKWNDEVPSFYTRIDDLDDRSYSIVSASIIEHHLDVLLGIIMPDFESFISGNDITFSIKTKLLKSLRLIPSQVFDFINLVRDTRNIFAHNYEIDSLEDLKKDLKNSRNIKIFKKLNSLGADYEFYFNFFLGGKYDPFEYRKNYECVVRIAIEALREYEPNITAMRNEIDGKGFEQKLSKKYNNRIRELKYID